MNAQKAFVVKNKDGNYYYGKDVFGKNLRKAKMYSSYIKASRIAEKSDMNGLILTL